MGTLTMSLVLAELKKHKKQKTTPPKTNRLKAISKNNTQKHVAEQVCDAWCCPLMIARNCLSSPTNWTSFQEPHHTSLANHRHYHHHHLTPTSIHTPTQMEIPEKPVSFPSCYSHEIGASGWEKPGHLILS